MSNSCPSCREPLQGPSGDGCAAMTQHTLRTFNKDQPLLNLTLDTDELGIWLIDETPEGPQQMGFISWKEITRGVKQSLLQEEFLLELAELDKEQIDAE